MDAIAVRQAASIAIDAQDPEGALRALDHLIAMDRDTKPFSYVFLTSISVVPQFPFSDTQRKGVGAVCRYVERAFVHERLGDFGKAKADLATAKVMLSQTVGSNNTSLYYRIALNSARILKKEGKLNQALGKT